MHKRIRILTRKGISKTGIKIKMQIKIFKCDYHLINQIYMTFLYIIFINYNIIFINYNIIFLIKYLQLNTLQNSYKIKYIFNCKLYINRNF